MITVGSDCSGVGALLQALNRIDNNYREIFSSDFDYYARLTYLYNYGTEKDCELALTKEHKYYADNVKRISLKDGIITSEDMEILDEANQFSKKFSFYYPFSMYQRDIPDNPLDVYMSSVPCQSFSLAGNRKGEEDKRGVLFYNSHEFIKINKPRFFIFENVKGLLSDDSGKTFGRWVDYLGGKSINGIPSIFPHEESVPYHIYYQVLNAKHYGIPQNRERIFIVGIRDDKDNRFQFPTEIPLVKRLKDVLEDNVDEKYYLSETLIKYFEKHKQEHAEKGNGFAFVPRDIYKPATTISTKAGTRQTDNYIKVKSATTKGYEVAQIGEDSINLEHPNSTTRRGRVGVGVGQTLTTSCNQGVAIIQKSRGYNKGGIFKEYSPTITINSWQENNHIQSKADYRIRKLTPIECFRLMDFPDSLVENARKVNMSDSQLYKQAGNSIAVGVLERILKPIVNILNEKN